MIKSAKDSEIYTPTGSPDEPARAFANNFGGTDSRLHWGFETPSFVLPIVVLLVRKNLMDREPLVNPFVN
jgi:hypothetical protein